MTMAGDDEIDATNDIVPTEAELQHFNKLSVWHDEVPTKSSDQQREVEQDVFLLRKSLANLTATREPRLYRERHVAWLFRALDYLPTAYEALSAAQPWIAFWIVHSLDLLGATIPAELCSRIVAHLRCCKDDRTGGFGGGRGQTGHLASTYAATVALCTLGTQEAMEALDVTELHRFLRDMKTERGGFRVSPCGEEDVRAMYSALCVASITGIAERDPTIFDGCVEYVRALCAFDGGFGGEPGNEAHGGNTYCATASLVIMGQLGEIDVEALLDWAVMRQMSFEGGFQGRTNKLVDSCYSFWVGALFPLLGYADSKFPYHPVNTEPERSSKLTGLFDGEALQQYVVECAQTRRGGFRDKPGLKPDYLHTCYALSGLSIAQQFGGATVNENIAVKETDAVYNLSREKAVEARLYFKS